MKFFFLLVSLVAATSTAFAQDSEIIRAKLESQKKCGSFVDFDENNLYMGFGGVTGSLKILSLSEDKEIVLPTTGSPLGLVTHGGHTFVLTSSTVEEWNTTEQKKVSEAETYALGHPKAYMEHAQGWAQYQDKMIIAHGRLGISIYDLTKKRLVNQFRLLREQMPLESMAMDVSVEGRYAYIVMDNFSLVRPPAPPPFRGIITLDLETNKIISQGSILDPGVTSVWSSPHGLIVSYGGSAFWTFDLVNGKVAEDPTYLRHRFPYKGHPSGRGSMDQKYFYTCYLMAPEYPGENGGRYKNVPTALERVKLGF
ncbi:hypothetical protein AZI86_03785 [Bdellovibrio bacteriovorus]|uniref:Uncharacterized protein n=1 Tax=Bdellovibrio bacteriovorus TaxID=959 RepID=A0A150WNW5_BDEBC|nr:hypothetical protein [Bdellovibrio bacteriovorus]KYG66191.1 hypothetical protein AZI86_03785 [Bdellovibrio bacteriovorus]